MSATGLDVFDKTIHATHIWLGEVMERLDIDRQGAWKTLSVVLQALRDRLPVELAAHLGAQLPLLIRGVYYDQFDPVRAPGECRTPEEFTREISERLAGMAPVDPEDAARVVFALLAHHVSEGQVAKVRHALPRAIQILWDGLEARELAQAGA